MNWNPDPRFGHVRLEQFGDLEPLKSDRNAASEDSLIAIAGGGGVNLFHSMGNAWIANYLQITCELDADLRSKSESENRLRTSHQFH